jgi:hypothetical protein
MEQAERSEMKYESRFVVKQALIMFAALSDFFIGALKNLSRSVRIIITLDKISHARSHRARRQHPLKQRAVASQVTRNELA